MVFSHQEVYEDEDPSGGTGAGVVAGGGFSVPAGIGKFPASSPAGKRAARPPICAVIQWVAAGRSAVLRVAASCQASRLRAA